MTSVTFANETMLRGIKLAATVLTGIEHMAYKQTGQSHNLQFQENVESRVVIV